MADLAPLNNLCTEVDLDFDLPHDLEEAAAQSTGPWRLEDATALCCIIEAIAPNHGCHVALTGGTLYKQGGRKDVDIMFYRIRQVEEIDRDGLINALEQIGLTMTTRHGWVQKALYQGKPVDLFFPDHVDGELDPATGEYA